MRKKETVASRKHNNRSRTQQGNIAVQVKGKRESEGEQGISRRGRKGSKEARVSIRGMRSRRKREEREGEGGR